MWSVAGHNRTVGIFQRSLREGRLGHAYLLVGRAHVGKMTLALDVARALNCTGEAAPCGQCSACRRILLNRHPDVMIVGLDTEKASKEGKTRKEISIDGVKAILRAASLPPFEGRYKVFIINDAECLSGEAANCLLKTLEEPPARVLFLLLTARESGLLPTIVSRCIRLELQPLPLSTVEAFLREREVNAEKARTVARLSKGCPGWALNIAGDEGSWQQRSELLTTLTRVLDSGLEERFAFAAELAGRFEKDRAAVNEILEMWLDWWRDLLLVRAGLASDIVNFDQEEILREWAGAYSLQEIAGFIRHLIAAREQLRWNANARLALEVLMLNLPNGNREETKEDVLLPSYRA
ncbi:MAG: DNA polymerase III subunit [Dehalococcoidia bacterium]|nr:DNA polymerase III subunit [Dehalococcoidia bacterium]